jgi:hypothetical protein
MSECHICGRSTTYGNDPTCECDEDIVSLRRHVAKLESLVEKALVSHDRQAETITRLTEGIAKLEDAVWTWATASCKQDADQKLLDFIHTSTDLTQEEP